VNGTQKFSPAASAIFLAARALMAVAFMSLALGGFAHFEELCGALSALGAAAPQKGCAAALAVYFFGAVSLGLGFKARLGALLLACGLLPAAWILLTSRANPIFLLAALAALGGVLPFIAAGAGNYSLDELRKNNG